MQVFLFLWGIKYRFKIGTSPLVSKIIKKQNDLLASIKYMEQYNKHGHRNELKAVPRLIREAIQNVWSELSRIIKW